MDELRFVQHLYIRFKSSIPVLIYIVRVVLDVIFHEKAEFFNGLSSNHLVQKLWTNYDLSNIYI